jgi:hypothetical protein
MKIRVEVLKNATYNSPPQFLMRTGNYVRGCLQGCECMTDDGLIKYEVLTGDNRHEPPETPTA